MDEKLMPDYTEVMSRIKLVTDCNTQEKLARFLGIRQSSISDAKKRGRIPPEWLLTLWRKTGTNPDWILWGQGAMRLQPAELSEQAHSVIYIKEVRPPSDCSIEELVTEIVLRVQRNAETSPKIFSRD